MSEIGGLQSNFTAIERYTSEEEGCGSPGENGQDALGLRLIPLEMTDPKSSAVGKVSLPDQSVTLSGG
jgi:hypothetical protein